MPSAETTFLPLLCPRSRASVSQVERSAGKHTMPRSKVVAVDPEEEELDEARAREDDLKWRPGLSGKEAKLRANKLREASVKRGLSRAAKREASQAERQGASSSLDPNAAPSAPLDISEPAPSPTHDDVTDQPEVASEGSAPLFDPLEAMPLELWSDIMESGWLDALSLCALACSCTELARLAARPALWDTIHEHTFGSDAALAEAALPGFLGARSPGARQRCVTSESELDAWRRASALIHELPLAAMTSVSLGLEGGLAVSTHDGRMARLWEPASGRRLACHQHKSRHALTCCDAAGTYAAIGDAGGVVHLYDISSDADFAPAQVLAATDASAIGSVAVLRSAVAGGAPACVSSTVRGSLTVQRFGANAGHTWHAEDPFFSTANRAVGLAACEADHVFVVSAQSVNLVDIEHQAVLWNAEWGVASESESFELHCAFDMLTVMDESTTGRRLASYSHGWRLLAAVCGDGCRLWDTRAPPDGNALAARVRLPSPLNAGSVTLEQGGGAWGGCLFVSSAASPSAAKPPAVHIYDIRCARAQRASSAGPPLFERVAGPITPPRRQNASLCFAANAERLVVGGGAKSTAAYQWLRDGTTGGGSESTSMRDASGEAAGGSARSKPRRQASAKSHNRASRPQ